MAGLLVSVRSAEEAVVAVEAGASVVDVKEPSRGSLGRADPAVWAKVREAVGGRSVLSAALGELAEASDDKPLEDDLTGFAYTKVGLAGAGPSWNAHWQSMIRRSGRESGWIAVIYADWQEARSPRPEHVLDAALETDRCAGVLFDTWDKSQRTPITLDWRSHFDRIRAAGKISALAGGLDRESIVRLAPLGADLIAVRGAACARGERIERIDSERVAALSRLVKSL